ncbi:hypothetical protein PENSUB_8758 [Penicillium subrubescens]|uniref:Uncharacterized protein n=1 Tax=Penicillium subrubescens TaxID=1316194 RepID=A0A1Q5TF64_9EURO|nr:hypothetical protein PENSUB_8758 [Penicillium subrubescens]
MSTIQFVMFVAEIVNLVGIKRRQTHWFFNFGGIQLHWYIEPKFEPPSIK